MAQAKGNALIRIALRIARLAGGLLALALGLVMLVSWLGSSIPRNPDWQEPEDGIEILVETNGVHTALVLPLVTPQKDWRQTFPVRHVLDQHRPYTHLSVSWGEKTVFLEANPLRVASGQRQASAEPAQQIRMNVRRDALNV